MKQLSAEGSIRKTDLSLAKLFILELGTPATSSINPLNSDLFCSTNSFVIPSLIKIFNLSGLKEIVPLKPFSSLVRAILEYTLTKRVVVHT
jgi:hypothetical protein